MATHQDSEKVTRVVRQTFPTASFSLPVSQVKWIAEESKKRGISKSALAREAFDSAMRESETKSGKAA